MEQLQSLLAETENDLASKTEEIRALEVQLKRGRLVDYKIMQSVSNGGYMFFIRNLNQAIVLKVS